MITLFMFSFIIASIHSNMQVLIFKLSAVTLEGLHMYMPLTTVSCILHFSQVCDNKETMQQSALS